jgi:hypothetical protein
MRRGRTLAVAVFACGAATTAESRADSTPTSDHAEQEPPRSAVDAVRQSTNPVPTTVQLIFQPAYTFPNGSSRYIAQLLFQANLPYRGFLVPDVDVPGFRSVARLQVSGVSLETTTPSGVNTQSGITDLSFVDGVVHRFGPFEGGLGFGSVFPMATAPALGQGKLQLGPAVLVTLLDVPWLQVGALAQVLWSVAGNSQNPSLAYATVQPLVAVLLPGDCSVFTNDTMSFYWEGSGTTVPINVGFGHGFSEHFVGQLQGAHVVAGTGKGNYQAILVLNFQP